MILVRFLLMSVVAALIWAVPAQAILVRTDGPALLGNPGGALLAADGLDGDGTTNRHLIQLRGSTSIFASGPTGNTGTFRAQLSLVDAGGVPVAFDDGAGDFTTTLTTASQSVALAAGVTQELLFAADGQAIFGLDFALLYRVRVVIERFTGGVWVAQSTVLGALQPLMEIPATVSPDAPYNLVASLASPTLQNPVIIRNPDGSGGFLLNSTLKIARYDDIGEPAPVDDVVTVSYTLVLRDETAGVDVPLAQPTPSTDFTVASHVGTGAVRDPFFLTAPVGLEIVPADWSVFDYTHSYSLSVEAMYLDPAVGPVAITPAAVVVPGGAQRLLALTGVLRFGGVIDGVFSAIAGDPRASFVNNGDGTYDGSVVIASGAGQIGTSVRRFGDGIAPLGVVLFQNGDLACLSGALSFNTVETDMQTINGVRVVRGPATLDNTGLRFAQFFALLPTGCGFTTTAQSRKLRGAHAWNNLPCDDDLLPLGGGPLTISAADYGVPELHVVQEGHPVRMRTTAIEWNLDLGQFNLDPFGGAEYVRREDDAQLVAATGAAPPTNDGYFRSVVSHQASVITVDEAGRGLLTTLFEFSNGDFRAHHPYQAQVAWSGGGTMQITQGRVVVAGSVLTGATIVEVPYERGCPKDGACAQVQATMIVCQPVEDWGFTPDGGLRATMQFASAEQLRWGKNQNLPPFYAHQTAGFEGARFHMTGTTFRPVELDGATYPGGQQAAILHHTGYSAPGDDTRRERPGVTPDTAAREGLADYAGLNFRASEMAVRTATSRLAGGSVGPYPLHPAAKYYARFSGVSGRHQAAASTPGAPSVSSVIMFGFQCQLDGLKLGYLDSDNVFSLTGGSIHVPEPSGFDQTFAELRFDCAGRPRDAVLADELDNQLVHWNTVFTPLTIRFQPRLSGGCPSFDSGALVLGAAVKAVALTAQPLHAELGFLPSGAMVTKGMGPQFAGVSSELMLPSQLKIKGGNGPDYTLTPHGKGYFSSADPVVSGQPASPALGWINLYGGLDVPFFQDAKVHLHVRNASSAAGGLVDLMGGWPSSDAASNTHGWADPAGRTPFNDPLFDGDQRGSPVGVGLAAYRASPTALYRPRAEQDWLEVVKLGYALKWETAARRFTTQTDEETDLVVVKAKHRLLSLTSSTAEITFGVKVEGFPSLNVSKLLTDQLNSGLNGLFASLTEAGLNAAGLNDAVQQFDALLEARIGELLDVPLDAALGAAEFDFDPLAWSANPSAGALAYANQVAGLARPEAVGEGQLTAELDRKLGAVVQALDILVSLIPSGDPAQNLGNLAEALLTNAQDTGSLNLVLQPLIDQIVDAARTPAQAGKSLPAFEELRSTAERVRNRVVTLRSTLNSGTNPLRLELQRAFDNDKAAYQTRIQSELQAFFAPLGASPAAVQQAIDERGLGAVRSQLNARVKRVVLTSGLAGPVQAAIKQHLAEPQAMFRGTLDSLFGEVNRAIRDAVKGVISEGAADALGLNSVNPGLGVLSSTFKGFGIDGYAQINGDSLQRLRIDGKLALKAADEMEFRGWLQIDALNAKNPRTKCYCDDPAAMRDGVEVIVGGEAPFSLFGGGDDATKLRVQGQFAFGGCGPGTPTTVLGVAGSFFLQGSINIASIQIKELGLTFAFGRASNYFGARARAAFQGYEFAGAFFAGSTCGLAPLMDVDPDIVTLLTSPSVGVLGPGDDPENTRITGLYVYAEGWMPLNNIIGIPDSCLFSLRAGAGAGPFAFVKYTRSPGPPPTETATDLLLGSKQFFGITADVLCLAHAEARVKLLGALTIPIGEVPPQNGVRQGTAGLALRLLGLAEFEVEVGPCPFCISFSKDVKFHAQLGGNATSFGFGH